MSTWLLIPLVAIGSFAAGIRICYLYWNHRFTHMTVDHAERFCELTMLWARAREQEKKEAMSEQERCVVCGGSRVMAGENDSLYMDAGAGPFCAHCFTVRLLTAHMIVEEEGVGE